MADVSAFGQAACAVKKNVTVPTPNGRLRAVLHTPPCGFAPSSSALESAACVMVGGAGGGIHGPCGMYERLGGQVALLGVTSLRVDYRTPNNLGACIEDTHAGVEYLVRECHATRVVLVGWSFGGAVVIRAAARHPVVVGAATIASQTYGALDTVSQLGEQGKSLLLIHGTDDDCLPVRCSQSLYAAAGEPKDIIVYTGDNHGIHRHNDEAVSELCAWAQRTFERHHIEVGGAREE